MNVIRLSDHKLKTPGPLSKNILHLFNYSRRRKCFIIFELCLEYLPCMFNATLLSDKEYKRILIMLE